MQLRSRCLTAAFAAAAFAVAGCGGSHHDETTPTDDRADGPLVAAMMPNIPPYLYLDPDTGEVKGIDVDIVRAAAARLGRDLEIRTVPFAEILPSVKNGTADFAAAAITITEGRTRPHGRRGGSWEPTIINHVEQVEHVGRGS